MLLLFLEKAKDFGFFFFLFSPVNIDVVLLFFSAEVSSKVQVSLEKGPRSWVSS